MGLAVGAWLTIGWTNEVAVREWPIDDEEREQRRRMADSVRTGTAQMGIGPQRLTAVAFQILMRHYDGQPTTRAACVDARVCTQQEWNTVDAVFKALGWKSGHTLQPGPNLPTAWAQWKQNVEWWDTGELWVRGEGGHQERIVL